MTRHQMPSQELTFSMCKICTYCYRLHFSQRFQEVIIKHIKNTTCSKMEQVQQTPVNIKASYSLNSNRGQKKAHKQKNGNKSQRIAICYRSLFLYGAVDGTWTQTSVSSPPPQDGVSAFPPQPHVCINMVPQDRIELSTHGFSVHCSTDWATEANLIE